MPLKIDIKKKLSTRSDRVKCVDIHPTEPWILASLFNGVVHIWNVESQSLIKTFEVAESVPVRTAKFAARKNWVITGSDDFHICVFNYNTLERVNRFEAHGDYIRCLLVHPTQPYLLSSADDNSIKLWNWDANWRLVQQFEGHCHYVMHLVFNPKDNNYFASASLDKTVKVWNLSATHPHFTLEGHERGVNCVDYCHGGDKPYLASGADDATVKIWDYNTRTCVQTLTGHANNVSAVCFHPELPIILSGSEDNTVRVWDSRTYRLTNTLNYSLDRVWTIGGLQRSNMVAIGHDEGLIAVKFGREEPAITMDATGKIIFARHSVFYQANIRSLEANAFGGGGIDDNNGGSVAGNDASLMQQDGQRLPLPTKELCQVEIYPQTIKHNANGKFVTIVGEDQFSICTAISMRNQHFGKANDLVWAAASVNPLMYATMIAGSNQIQVDKKFACVTTFKPDTGGTLTRIFGGHFLGVLGPSGLLFYDWLNPARLIRRIDVTPTAVYWNEGGRLVALVCEQNYFILQVNHDVIAAAANNEQDTDADGIEGALDLLERGEVSEVVRTGCWVGDCFLYTNAANRLVYFVGGELVTVAHLDRPMTLLGYLPFANRAYLADNDLQIVSYQLLVPVMEYQTLVMRKDFTAADAILPSIPEAQRPRVAQFLEKQGFPAQALAVTTDPEHKFELALSMGKLDVVYELVQAETQEALRDAGGSDAGDVIPEQKWRQLAEAASKACDFELAQKCMLQTRDFASLLLMASCSGNAQMVSRVAAESSVQTKDNVAFLARFLLGDLEGCLRLLIEAERLPEAGFFARTYLPSQVPHVTDLWRAHLIGRQSGTSSAASSAASANHKAAQALANPRDYPNLFPGYAKSLELELYLKQCRLGGASAKFPDAQTYPSKPANCERDLIKEMREFNAAAAAGGESAASAAKQLANGDSPVSATAAAATVVASNQETPAESSNQETRVAEVPREKTQSCSSGGSELERELASDLANLDLDTTAAATGSGAGSAAKGAAAGGGGGGWSDEEEDDDEFE